jgi:hypothetical protein
MHTHAHELKVSPKNRRVAAAPPDALQHRAA